MKRFLTLLAAVALAVACSARIAGPVDASGGPLLRVRHALWFSFARSGGLARECLQSPGDYFIDSIVPGTGTFIEYKWHASASVGTSTSPTYFTADTVGELAPGDTAVYLNAGGGYGYSVGFAIQNSSGGWLGNVGTQHIVLDSIHVSGNDSTTFWSFPDYGLHYDQTQIKADAVGGARFTTGEICTA